jgi:sn-glycerol 3-phosphate transport system permease protein
MVENRPWTTILAHLVLIAGVVVMAFPLWVAFVASTLDSPDFNSIPVPLLPGGHLIENYRAVLGQGVASIGGVPAGRMLANSLVMALSVAVGKIVISLFSAYAIVFFRFPLRRVIFWVIFMTLMLPVEVRILPTFKVAADLGLLNSYVGLTVPLIASATATFLFRQFFLTIPDELLEAARLDGAGPWRFFKDIVLPLSWTNIAALFVILFIFGWNQYLWPLLVTTDERFYTIVVGIQRLVTVADSRPQWHLLMATTILALLPPVLVVVLMQRLFVKGLVETEK